MLIKYLRRLRNQNGNRKKEIKFTRRNNGFERQDKVGTIEKVNWLGRPVASEIQTNTDIKKPEK